MSSPFLSKPKKKPLKKGEVNTDASLPSLKKYLDIIFSRWVRKQALKDGKVICYTCDEAVLFADSECSHFIRRANSATRYSEVGCKASCWTCNNELGGNLEVYRERLVAEYGEAAVEELEFLGRSEMKYSRFEIVELIEKYSK